MNKHLIIVSSLLVLAIISIAGIVAVTYKQTADFQSTTAELRAQNEYLLSRVNEVTRRGVQNTQSTQSNTQALSLQLENTTSRYNQFVSAVRTYWGQPLIDVETVAVGDTIGNFTVVDVSPIVTSSPTIPRVDNLQVVLAGEISLTGTYVSGLEDAFAGLPSFQLSEASQATLPLALGVQSLRQFNSSPWFSNESYASTLLSETTEETTITVDQITYTFFGGDVKDQIRIKE